MKVWIVTSGQWDDYDIEGVFSSKEKALAFINEEGFRALRAEHPKAEVVAQYPRSWLNQDIDSVEVADFNEPMEMGLDALPPTVWKFFPKGRKGPSHPDADTIGRKYEDPDL